mmetsp:Transcript_8399/g.24140  ORF Transcript_8399/g.24140 Transcript_8399/m.24140 type:complete len:239 (-) Transcript_8399:533-1249(-)
MTASGTPSFASLVATMTLRSFWPTEALSASDSNAWAKALSCPALETMRRMTPNHVMGVLAGQSPKVSKISFATASDTSSVSATTGLSTSAPRTIARPILASSPLMLASSMSSLTLPISAEALLGKSGGKAEISSPHSFAKDSPVQRPGPTHTVSCDGGSFTATASQSLMTMTAPAAASGIMPMAASSACLTSPRDKRIETTTALMEMASTSTKPPITKVISTSSAAPSRMENQEAERM